MQNVDGRWTALAATGIELVAGSSMTLTFADGRIAAYAGCNRMSAQGGIEGSTVELTGPLISTMMHCEGVMDQERWLAALLEAGPSWKLRDEHLVLTSGENSLTLGRGEDATATG